nr:MAG TPA: Protein of unknown function (DUF3102) [Caudoviricetes sp.]
MENNEVIITKKAYEVHARIMANGQVLQNTLLEICKDLKTMRDEKLYSNLGYSTFEDYAENACGIKQRQAYSYISTYEKLGEKLINDMENVGITKLALISEISSYERDEFINQTDIENSTVKELKAKVEEFKRQTEQLTLELEEYKSAPAPEVDSTADKTAELENQIKQLKQTAADKEKQLKQKYEQKVKNAVADEAKKAESLKSENEELKTKLKTVDEKLNQAVSKAKAAGADSDVAALKVYFDTLQSNAKRCFEYLSKIKAKDSATASRLASAMQGQFTEFAAECSN